MGNDGGAKGIRTPDLLNAIQTLSQLSYSPTAGAGSIARGLRDQRRPPSFVRQPPIAHPDDVKSSPDGLGTQLADAHSKIKRVPGEAVRSRLDDQPAGGRPRKQAVVCGLKRRTARASPRRR